MRVKHRNRNREGAFTIVEVLIGALLVTIVFAGAMYFIVGSGKTQQKSLVRQRMSAAADDITQKVRADANWLKATPSCKTSKCDVSGQFPVPPPKAGDPKLDAQVTITPIDSRSDLTGTADEDGVRPDFYRIQVVVSMSATEQAKWGKQAPFEAVSTIDATAIGRAVGSLVVQACEVVNQVDERTNIAGCDGGGGTHLDMNRQPAPCSSPFPMSWDDWLNARPSLPLECNKAFDTASSQSSYLGQMHVRGASTNVVSFTLTRDNSDGGPATKRLISDADTAAANGTYVFTGLPAGTYKIEVTPKGSRELWKSKSVPSALRASVQGNQEARALLVVRPLQDKGQYGARFTRAVWLYHLSTFTDSTVDDEVYDDFTIRTTTTYVYLHSNKPTREVWDGPAWNGIVSMEAKPFDRYRSDNGIISQPTNLIQWQPKKDPQGGWRAFSPLATGLHSLPTQQPNPDPLPPAPMGDLFGSLGTRTQQCQGGTPGGSCGEFGWIRHEQGNLGTADSTVTFHSEDGECYVESTVPGYTIQRQLQLGGSHATRCSRDLVYINPETGKRTVIPDFLPDKQGNGGGTMVLSMQQTTECIGCPIPVPPSTGSVGYVDPSTSGDGASVTRTGSPPASPPAPPPKIVVKTPPKPATSTTPAKPASTQTLPAAGALPASNSAGGGGGSTFP